MSNRAGRSAAITSGAPLLSRDRKGAVTPASTAAIELRDEKPDGA
jgi:hypothetical protein